MKDGSNHRVYLASGSPRRRELLARLGVASTVCPVPIDETPQAGELPEAYVLRLAQEKNVAARKALHMADAPVLTADTTVALDGQIFGKPVDTADAARMLRQLSGRTHQVHTAVCVFFEGREAALVNTSDVCFADLTDDDIARYLAMGEFADKAGAYGIQGAAGMWVRHLSGSYDGVMGLPLFETAQLLTEIGGMRLPISEPV